MFPSKLADLIKYHITDINFVINKLINIINIINIITLI